MKVKLFTEAEAAKQLDVSEGTLARWRRTHYIRHWRQMGRLVRYTQEDINQNLLERHGSRPQLVERPVSEARFG